MRKIRNIFAGFLGQSLMALGLTRLANSRIMPGDILPLCFHNPTRHLFEHLIGWLRNEDYEFISCDRLLDILAGHVTLNKKAVWISFDDGWRDTLENVIPLLMEADIPAIYFLTTEPIIDPQGIFWWSLMRANQRHLPGKFCKNVELIWEISQEERLQLIKEVRNTNSARIPRQAFTVAEVRALAKLPQITIGGHTDQHRLATNYSAEEFAAELQKSNQSLREWSDKEIKFFAYPKGVYDRGIAEIIRREGYVLAATTDITMVKQGDYSRYDLFRLPRIPIPDDGFFPEILCHAMGIWQPFMRKTKLALRFNPDKVIHRRGY